MKEGFLYDTLNLINLNGDDKRRCQEEDRRKVYDRLFQRQKAVKPKKDQQEETQQQHEEWTKKYEDKHLGGFRFDIQQMSALLLMHWTIVLEGCILQCTRLLHWRDASHNTLDYCIGGMHLTMH